MALVQREIRGRVLTATGQMMLLRGAADVGEGRPEEAVLLGRVGRP